ncbi:MAG: SH3 beta-barrel fold-containing protein [Prevotella sp.]|nr:SH3 beta-barrel fold-containing protein [Prevotella sp.]
MEYLFETLVEKLHKGIVSFVYRKKDGTKRYACGTLYGIGHTIKGNGGGHHCRYTLAYYDVDCKGWRSFLIENLIEVGELRKSTIEEHHEICLALVVKLKDKMRKEGKTAFAYRKADGSIRYAHGILSDSFDVTGRYFVYFDTDKQEERKFRIDAFVGIGEPEELRDERISFTDDTFSATRRCKSYDDFSSLDIKTILAKRGVAIEDTENFMVIDLLPELSKAQLRDLICKATERLASL